MSDEPQDRWEQTTPFGRVFGEIRILWQKAQPNRPMDEDIIAEFLNRIRPLNGDEAAWLKAARAQLGV